MTPNLSKADIPNAIVDAMMKCPDYADFPTAWAIQNSHGPTLTHHPRCSSVPGWDAISGPSFLCDCNAVQDEWRRIRELLATPTSNIKDNPDDQ